MKYKIEYKNGKYKLDSRLESIYNSYPHIFDLFLSMIPKDNDEFYLSDDNGALTYTGNTITLVSPFSSSNYCYFPRIIEFKFFNDNVILADYQTTSASISPELSDKLPFCSEGVNEDLEDDIKSIFNHSHQIYIFNKYNEALTEKYLDEMNVKSKKEFNYYDFNSSDCLYKILNQYFPNYSIYPISIGEYVPELNEFLESKEDIEGFYKNIIPDDVLECSIYYSKRPNYFDKDEDYIYSREVHFNHNKLKSFIARAESVMANNPSNILNGVSEQDISVYDGMKNKLLYFSPYQKYDHSCDYVYDNIRKNMKTR